MFSLALKILISQDHDSQNTACFGKDQQNFLDSKYYESKDGSFLLERKNKIKKKITSFPKHLMVEVLNTKV